MDVHVTSADPLGLGTLDGSNGINVVAINGGPVRQFHEVLAGNGKYIGSAVKILKPIEEWTVDYELLDGASFSLAFGVLVNSSYLVTAFSASHGAENRPTVSVTAMKPSAANLIKAYAGGAVSVTLAGGFGIVEKWGATAAAAFLSAQCSISMQTLEGMDETSGDFMVGGIYHYGFKKEVSVEAYGAITVPAGSHYGESKKRQGRDQIQIYSTPFWSYMDPA
jgi:hypothetical protein